ncbi:hypothetical protein E1301_Tti018763 [Triplophysa tibetana]|uniref:Uncharacterized protein n=1 Tax=Triplophysa tibetana TaxID=1572043 RepID=A0A5A9NF57_9TELE|nr:hypothetical protein E1301_Tti018763 [Triplophysa tibetana]
MKVVNGEYAGQTFLGRRITADVLRGLSLRVGNGKYAKQTFLGRYTAADILRELSLQVGTGESTKQTFFHRSATVGSSKYTVRTSLGRYVATGGLEGGILRKGPSCESNNRENTAEGSILIRGGASVHIRFRFLLDPYSQHLFLFNQIEWSGPFTLLELTLLVSTRRGHSAASSSNRNGNEGSTIATTSSSKLLGVPIRTRSAAVDEEELENVVRRLHVEFPNSWNEIMRALLIAEGLIVSRQRVREMLVRVNPAAAARRWSSTVARRVSCALPQQPLAH